MRVVSLHEMNVCMCVCVECILYDAETGTLAITMSVGETFFYIYQLMVLYLNLLFIIFNARRGDQQPDCMFCWARKFAQSLMSV